MVVDDVWDPTHISDVISAESLESFCVSRPDLGSAKSRRRESGGREYYGDVN